MLIRFHFSPRNNDKKNHIRYLNDNNIETEICF